MCERCDKVNIPMDMRLSVHALPKDTMERVYTNMSEALKTKDSKDVQAEKDIMCGGPTVAEMLKSCEQVRQCINHLKSDHGSLFVDKRVENMVIDALGINIKRFKSRVPDECVCVTGLKYDKCRCPNDSEVDLVISGRRMAAIKALQKRKELADVKIAQESLDFYCPA